MHVLVGKLYLIQMNSIICVISVINSIIYGTNVQLENYAFKTLSTTNNYYY